MSAIANQSTAHRRRKEPRDRLPVLRVRARPQRHPREQLVLDAEPLPYARRRRVECLGHRAKVERAAVRERADERLEDERRPADALVDWLAARFGGSIMFLSVERVRKIGNGPMGAHVNDELAAEKVDLVGERVALGRKNFAVVVHVRVALLKGAKAVQRLHAVSQEKQKNIYGARRRGGSSGSGEEGLRRRGGRRLAKAATFHQIHTFCGNILRENMRKGPIGKLYVRRRAVTAAGRVLMTLANLLYFDVRYHNCQHKNHSQINNEPVDRGWPRVWRRCNCT